METVSRLNSALPAPDITCSSCQASCCSLEVMLVTETGVPDRFTKIDKWGGKIMARLEDGKCSALDRTTMLCTIYENRPWICREFEAGASECLSTRVPNQL